MFAPVFNKNYNCMDVALANVARFHKRDHELMFLGAWGFRFSDNTSLPIEKRLKTDWQSTREYLSLFHGIQKTNRDVSDLSIQKDTIVTELQHGKVVIVKSDAYKCRWNLAYGQYHIPHFYVIESLTKNEYRCIDTYSSNNYEYLQANEAFDTIYTFQCHEVTKESIVSNAKQLLGGNDFFCRISVQKGMLEDFSNEIVNINYDDIASLGKDVWASPICRKIKEIGCGRKNFLLAITYLETIMSDCEMSEIKVKMNSITSDWDKVYRLLIKVSFLQDRESILKRIKELLNNIAYDETMLAEKIVSIFA